MERTTKTTLYGNGRQHTVYVTYDDTLHQPVRLLKVEAAGDLLDITDKLTDAEKRRIIRRLEKNR